MKKLMIAAAVAIGASAAFSEVYDVKYTLKAAVDVANNAGVETTSIKSITVQGLWNGEVDPAKADYRFWLVNGKEYTAIKDATLDYVASSTFLKKDVLDESQSTDELELIWKDENGNTCAIVAAGATKNKKVGKGDEAYYILNTMSGNAAGQISKAPVYGTWSVKINSTATKNGMDAATPKQFKTDGKASGDVFVDFGTSQKDALDAWKALAPNATGTAEDLAKTEAELAATKADLDQAWADLKALGGLYDESQANLAAANADIAAKTAKIAELEDEIAAKKAEIAALEAQLEALTDEMLKKIDELNAAKDACETLQAEKDALQAKYDALEAAAGKEKAELAAKIAALDAEIAEQKQFIEDQQKQIEDQQKQIDELNATIAMKDKEMEEFKAKMAKLIDDKDTAIAELEGKLAMTQAELDELVKNIKNLDVKDEVTKLISTYLTGQYELLSRYTNDIAEATALIRRDIFAEATDAKKAWAVAREKALASKDELVAQSNVVDMAQTKLDLYAAGITNSVATIDALKAQWAGETNLVAVRQAVIDDLNANPVNAVSNFYYTALTNAQHELEIAQENYAAATNELQTYINTNGQPNGEPLTLEMWLAKDPTRDPTSYQDVYVNYPNYVNGYKTAIKSRQDAIVSKAGVVATKKTAVEDAQKAYDYCLTNPTDTSVWKDAMAAAVAGRDAAQEKADFTKSVIADLQDNLTWTKWQEQKVVLDGEKVALSQKELSFNEDYIDCTNKYEILHKLMVDGIDTTKYGITDGIPPLYNDPSYWVFVETTDLKEMKAEFYVNPWWPSAQKAALAKHDGWVDNAVNRMKSIDYIRDNALADKLPEVKVDIVE